MKRLAFGACVSAMFAMATLTAPVSSAHAARIATDPAANAVLASGPQRVSATFNEQLQTTFAAMTVVGPDGNVWSAGEPTVAGAMVSIALRPLGPSGTYTVNYRVTSADGHVVSGSWSFQLTVSGTGTPGPPVAGGGGGGGDVPVWPFVAAALALVAGGVWWAVRHRR
ncbi:copper resistance protein CopC [Mycobacterium intracellulare]|uniref:copper resistance CopC family protein n=1 Tax=Mycobacterium intracellulare TaxID=1767 RepID=UPI0007EAA614|nr:copper resistance CopC family protein [Mycobacterium intracellulare]MCA2303263.1 copper resistance protein CopC [Mycobacterium intracellulare]MCA2349183.1 copper resistance protein CopC [Mycobacterium intracellulare]MEE3802004.1 copper resistance CopC family protein [Mycobacterium intracellulare]OBG18021.1 copper resistance protein CopC [Mycobacterium intracellulare]UQB87475.1 copper resistance protein CopC [Mycobacterium intracellulare]